MKWYKKQINSLIMYFGTLFLIIIMLIVVAIDASPSKIVVSNINTVKSVEASRIVPITSIFQSVTKPQDTYIKVFSTLEITNQKNKKIEFEGTLTGYGPDCVGCSGNLGCPPHQNVKNGNIYYNDNKYGKIRILAADSSIPCGSIIKISNYKYINEDFYGIVLDRGSDIHGLTMDLLYNSENETKSIGRAYNIDFKIERWGY